MKGFLHSLIGPVCLAFWSIIGVINYDLTSNIFSALKIAFIGSFLSATAINLLIVLGKRGVLKSFRTYVLWISRLLGAITNTVWNSLFLAFFIIFIFLLPNNFFGLGPLQNSFSKSLSYNLFYVYLIEPFPIIKGVLPTIAIFRDPTLSQKYRTSPEYRAIFSHPKIQRIIKNKKILAKIYSKDAIYLLQNPEFLSILKDKTLMKDISKLAAGIYKNNPRDPLDSSYFPTQN